MRVGFARNFRVCIVTFAAVCASCGAASLADAGCSFACYLSRSFAAGGGGSRGSAAGDAGSRGWTNHASRGFSTPSRSPAFPWTRGGSRPSRLPHRFDRRVGLPAGAEPPHPFVGSAHPVCFFSLGIATTVWDWFVRTLRKRLFVWRKRFRFFFLLTILLPSGIMYTVKYFFGVNS